MPSIWLRTGAVTIVLSTISWNSWAKEEIKSLDSAADDTITGMPSSTTVFVSFPSLGETITGKYPFSFNTHAK